MRVGIIGSAGRGSDLAKWNSEIYIGLLKELYALLNTFPVDTDEITLVSGGAAWADHTAIDLFTNCNMIDIERTKYDLFPFGFAGLDLYFPCDWDWKRNQFLDTGEKDYRINPGKTANAYHKQFSHKIGANSFNEIKDALNFSKVNHQTVFGFLKRNLEVAKVDVLIASTWSDNNEPKDGGTAHTWKNSKALTKIHINLNERVQLYPMLNRLEAEHNITYYFHNNKYQFECEYSYDLPFEEEVFNLLTDEEKKVIFYNLDRFR